jgi:hypothetical protein
MHVGCRASERSQRDYGLMAFRMACIIILYLYLQPVVRL